MTWKRGEYGIEIVTRTETAAWPGEKSVRRETVTATGTILNGVLGVHRVGKRRAVYAVTHLPTGCLVSPSGGFGLQATAKRYAETILLMADWNAVTRDNTARVNFAEMYQIAFRLLSGEVYRERPRV